MNYGFRRYLFEQDGTMRHVPHRVSEGLAWGTDRMPQYAGQKLRYVNVVLALADEKPTEILDIEAGYLDFDEEGRADRALREGAMQGVVTHRALETVKRSASSRSVVSLKAKLARQNGSGSTAGSLTQESSIRLSERYGQRPRGAQ